MQTIVTESTETLTKDYKAHIQNKKNLETLGTCQTLHKIQIVYFYILRIDVGSIQAGKEKQTNKHKQERLILAVECGQYYYA